MRSHGAYSPARVKRVARAQRRRFVNRHDLTESSLSGIQMAYLELWARCQAKIELIDKYCADHGLIRDDGTPQPAMNLYVTLTNSARAAMARLEASLREQPTVDPVATLNNYLRGKNDDGA